MIWEKDIYIWPILYNSFDKFRQNINNKCIIMCNLCGWICGFGSLEYIFNHPEYQSDVHLSSQLLTLRALTIDAKTPKVTFHEKEDWP